jgi:ElaB/YqjD/DUF883 family membrane-anchored ribosome-binding protein
MMASIKPEEMHKTIDKAAQAAQPVVERVVSSAHAGVDKLSGLLSGASETFSARSAQMNDTYQQLADSGREYVRNKPGTAVAIALGAGYILAKLLGGSRRRDY